MKKQTVANNDFLKKVRAIFNDKIFKHASLIVNTGGELVAREYLQQFIISSVEDVFAKLQAIDNRG